MSLPSEVPGGIASVLGSEHACGWDRASAGRGQNAWERADWWSQVPTGGQL